jgi:hypothetical protein
MMQSCNLVMFDTQLDFLMPSFFEIDYNNVKSIFSGYTNYTRLTEKIYPDTPKQL